MKTPQHPLASIAAGVVFATAITWAGGLLFGPMSETRARHLAQQLSTSAAAQRVAVRPASTIEGTQPRGAAPAPSALAS